MTSVVGDSDTNGNGNAPWWVSATFRLGVPAALAAYLVYFVTSIVSNAVAKTQYDLAVLTQTMSTHVESNERGQREIIRLLAVQCANAAKTTDNREACFGR